MILNLVKSFGATVSLALSAAPPVGVDLEAEQRYFLFSWILLLVPYA
jgi:hypothetical protein